MKVKSIFIICCLIGWTSAQSQKKYTREKEIDLLKQLGYCICMVDGYRQVTAIDSKDGSIGFMHDKMAINNLFDKHVYPAIKKQADKIIAVIANSLKDTLYVSHDVIELHSLSLSCLEFYKSKQLDSLVRSFRRSLYYNKAIGFTKK